MVRRLSLAILLALSPATSPAANAQPAPGDGFDVMAYDLALTPDLRTRAVAGREAIVVRATAGGTQSLVFSGNALAIDGADLDGRPVRAAHDGDMLRFDLPEPLVRGRTAKLAIRYHGQPARGIAGSASALYTSYFACDWMICLQDRFGDKAAFSLDLRVPAGMDTLSVGRRIAKRRGPEGSEIHRWKAPRPYSAYLYGFAIGHFARADEAAGGAHFAYLSDVADVAGLKRRLAPTPEMARFLADKAGVPLPVASYGQLLVAGDEAQEAATYSVLGVDALPAKDGDPSEDWAIVHELAHQWWGNLVTCTSIREFWLNEGITTFMTAAWKEHRYGRAAYDAELAVARSRLETARARGFDEPLAWGGRYPSLGCAGPCNIARARSSWIICAPCSAIPHSGRACGAIRAAMPVAP